MENSKQPVWSQGTDEYGVCIRTQTDTRLHLTEMQMMGGFIRDLRDFFLSCNYRLIETAKA